MLNFYGSMIYIFDYNKRLNIERLLMMTLKNYFLVFCGFTLMLWFSSLGATTISSSTQIKPHRGACRLPLNYSAHFEVNRDNLPNLKNYSESWPYVPNLSHPLPGADQLCPGVKYHFIVHLMVQQGNGPGGTVMIAQNTFYYTGGQHNVDPAISPHAFVVRNNNGFIAQLMASGVVTYPKNTTKASLTNPMFYLDRIQDPDFGDMYLRGGTLTIQSES